MSLVILSCISERFLAEMERVPEKDEFVTIVGTQIREKLFDLGWFFWAVSEPGGLEFLVTEKTLVEFRGDEIPEIELLGNFGI